MGQRVQLQALLEVILGTRNVYFQPPESIKLSYPCIIYSRNSLDTKFANDKPYAHKMRYSVVIIDQNPDSIIPAKVANLPSCIFDRHFKTENLNHDSYNIYY